MYTYKVKLSSKQVFGKVNVLGKMSKLVKYKANNEVRIHEFADLSSKAGNLINYMSQCS